MREEDTVCVGSDGLQYCKVCGEAKEAFFPEGGFMGMKKHSRQCACDRKAYEEEQNPESFPGADDDLRCTPRMRRRQRIGHRRK